MSSSTVAMPSNYALISSNPSVSSLTNDSDNSEDVSISYGDALISSDDQQSSSSYSDSSYDFSISAADLRTYTGYGAPATNTCKNSSGVPFRWEKAPGKPIPTCRELDTGNYGDGAALALQLPPKLHHIAKLAHQPANQSLLNFTQKPCIEQHGTKSSPCLSNSYSQQTPNIWYLHSQKLQQLCKSVLETASWSRPSENSPQSYQSWGSHDKSNGYLAYASDKVLFDTASPKQLRYSATIMDSLKPATFPLYDGEFSTLPVFDVSRREDENGRRDVLSFLTMDDHKTSSAPWQPILYPESESPSWLLATTDPSGMQEKVGEQDDHFFSTASSFAKQRMEERSDESANSLSSPWFLDFSPQEEDGHVKKGEGKVRLWRKVVLIKFKHIILSKLCGLISWKTREAAAFSMRANSTMWSPTLATYLYNLQNKERESIPSIENLKEEEEDKRLDEDQGPLKINYHLPSMIRGQLVAPNYVSEDGEDSMAGAHHEGRIRNRLVLLQEEEDKANKSRGFRVSLREKLAEFDDEYPEQTTHLSLGRGENKQGTCKLRKTAQALAGMMKVILEQTERKGQRRLRLISYGACIKSPLVTL